MMDDPTSITVCLREGESYVIVGDTTVSGDPTGGYILKSPGGFDGERLAVQRVPSDFTIGLDIRDNDGNIIRQTVVFESDST